MAEGFIQGQLNKPLFGRPYLKFGQCFGLWGYMIELGGILGAKHASKPDAFVPAFLGMSGAAGVAKRVLVEQANSIVQRHSLGSMNFWDYVGADVADRMGYKGDGWHSFVTERGAEKCPPKFALTNGWGYASAGAALGTTHPDILRAMLTEHMHEFQKKSGDLRMLLGWTLDRNNPRPATRKPRRLRIKTSWSSANSFA